MLLEFKVANFQCFKDEVTLSMIPGAKDNKLKGNQFQTKRNRVLKAAGIFGHNASGKSSLLQALQVMRNFVVHSATRMNIGDHISGVDPFRLASDTIDKPSSFEVLVELDGDEYRYGIKVTSKRVIEEKLEYRNAAKSSRAIQLFSRLISATNNTVEFNLDDKMGTKERQNSIIEDTRVNGLILSRAAERNVDIVLPLYEWFRNSIKLLFLNDMPSGEILDSIAKIASSNPEYQLILSQLIQDADTGIVGFEATSSISSFPVPDTDVNIKVEGDDDVPDSLKHAIIQLQSELAEYYVDRKFNKHKYVTLHKHSDTGLPVQFDWKMESRGTRQFLAVAGELLDCCSKGKLLIIDELDTSLHTQLAMRIIQLVHNQDFNHTGAQLVFSTHDTNLMDLDLLRRDQIWITQKNARGEGELYSLWDFEDKPRNNTPLARNYLAGRYGGVPVFGSQLEDIPQTDEPTPIKYTENN